MRQVRDRKMREGSKKRVGEESKGERGVKIDIR